MTLFLWITMSQTPLEQLTLVPSKLGNNTQDSFSFSISNIEAGFSFEQEVEDDFYPVFENQIIPTSNTNTNPGNSLKVVTYLHREKDRCTVFYSKDDRLDYLKMHGYSENNYRFPCYCNDSELDKLLWQLAYATTPLKLLNVLEAIKALKPQKIEQIDYHYFHEDADYTQTYPTYTISTKNTESVDIIFLQIHRKHDAYFISIEDIISSIKAKCTPILPFFRALNPCSHNSGINNLYRENKEVFDKTVSEKISKAFYSNHSFISGLCATYDILVGQHYVISNTDYFGRKEKINFDPAFFSGEGSKGLLDYFILPLVSRKLYMDSLQDNYFTQVLALLIVIPVELTRMTTGFALTLLLSPIVFLIHLVKSCFMSEELKNPEDDNTCFGWISP